MTSLFAIGTSFQELMPILLVALVLFGANRIPGMARSLAQGIREFRKGLREDEADSQPDLVKPGDPQEGGL